MGLKKTRGLLGFLAGLVLSSLAPAAWADVSIPGLNFNPSAGDQSLTMLGTIFGGGSSIGLLSGGSGPFAGAMSALMNTFNGAVLSLASIFAFYTIVSAVVQTAHDGEVLGKRYSSLWVPIRSAAGIAAIVPAGGYSAVQLLVLWVAAQGVGLANQLWTAGVGALSSPTAFVQQPVEIKDGEDLIRKLVPIAACLQANAEAIERAKASGIDAGDLPVETTRPATPDGGTLTTFSFGFQHASGAFSSCGSFSYDSKAGGVIERAIVQAQTAAVSSATASLRTAILTVGDPSQASNGTVLRAAMKAYNDTITNAVKAAIASQASAASQKYASEVQALANKGWSAAGGSFMALSKAAQSATPAIDVKSVFVTPAGTVAIDDPLIADRTKGLTQNTLAKLGTGTTGEAGDDAEGVTSKFLNKGFSWVERIAGINASNAQNPILYWKAMGDLILNGVGTMILVALGATFYANSVGGSAPAKAVNFWTGIFDGAKAVLRQIFLLMIFLVIGFATIGVTLAVYIPMLPYIIWVSVLLSWLVAVAEAVIASPLWMMLHLNPEGDGIASGATEAGYKFVAAIFLRPALSVISFFVACAVMFAIGGFVNSTIKEAYEATRADNSAISFSGIFAYIGYLFVMGGLAIAIVSKSFNLCLTIPETILRWIGSSMTGGESLAGEAKNEFAGAVGVVNKAGHQSLTPGGRGKGVPKVDGAEPTAPGTKMSGPEDPVVPRDSGGGGGQNGGSPERPKPGGPVDQPSD